MDFKMLTKSDGKVLRRSAAISALMMLAACGGSGGSSSTPTPPTTPPTTTTTTAVSITQADASRLVKQASFGPTKALVDHVVALGTASAWLDEQFGTGGSNYGDLQARAVATTYCSNMATAAQSVCNRDYMSSTPVAMEFYAHAAGNGDQLRQRVAFALSQIMVASDVEVHSTAGLATLNQAFIDGAFGNYKDLLKTVTLNAYMGDYLDMVNSNKSAPNENYARELMQLFSMGVNALNSDGSLLRDSSNAPIANYTADDVHSIARALTGWTYTRLNGAAISDNVNIDYSKPMIQNAAIYDTASKSFLGTSVAAGATQDVSLQTVVDAVFNNASTPPYVSKFLIEQLVTSNPSPAYVARITAVFVNNGSGVRGDMRAVIRAILLDAEARGDAKTGGSDGKVKEPALYSLAIARLIGDTTDGYAFTTRDAAMGQSPFRAGSVFNFYPPDYPLPLGGGLLSPPSKLMTAATIVARHNLAYDWTVTGDVGSRSEYAVQTTIAGATGTTPNWSVWEGFGTNVSGMIDLINLLMLNNTMSAAQRTALTNAANAITNADATVQARKRAQTMLYIVATSPQFQVDR